LCSLWAKMCVFAPLITRLNRLRQGLKVPVSRVAGLKTSPKHAPKDGLSGTLSPAKGKAGVFNP